MDRIKELIKELPGNDSLAAAKLIAKHDYVGLNSLVWSDIRKIQKAQLKKNCPEEYKDIDLHKLLELNTLVDNYNIDLLYGED